jgi:hypothetical protein
LTKEILTGKEKQLTFDGVIADDPLWMSNGTILYRSNKSGEFGVWAVDEKGGESVQLPLGSKRYFNISASGDGRRVLVYEADALSEIRVTDLKGRAIGGLKLDLFVGGGCYAMAPDFAQVAFVEPRPRHESPLYVADMAGTSRRKIAVSYWWLSNGVRTWSPDKTWLAYAGYTPSGRDEPLKGDIRITRSAGIGAPRIIRDQLFPWALAWIDTANFVFLSTDAKTLLHSLQDGTQKQVFEDSTFSVPILGGRYLVYRDLRMGQRGWFLAKLSHEGSKAGRPRNFLLTRRTSYSSDYRFWLYEKNPGEIWRITLPGCEEEYVGPMKDLGPLPFVQLSPDGQKIAYIRHNTTMRLTLIEDLFDQ